MWSDLTGNDALRSARWANIFTTVNEHLDPETHHPAQRQNTPDPEAADRDAGEHAGLTPSGLPNILGRHHDHPMVAWLLGDLQSIRRHREVNLPGLQPFTRPAPEDPSPQSHLA